MFINLYMFRATIGPSSGEKTVFLRHLALVILCGWLSGMQEHMLLHTRQSSTVIILRINRVTSWFYLQKFVQFIFRGGRISQFRRDREPERSARNVCGAKYTKYIVYPHYSTDWKSDIIVTLKYRNEIILPYIIPGPDLRVLRLMRPHGVRVGLGEGPKRLIVFKNLSKTYFVHNYLYCSLCFAN